MLQANKILHYLTNDGALLSTDTLISELVNYDYVQIELIGKHAKNTTDGNIMLVSRCDVNSVMAFKWYLNGGGYPSTYGTIDNSIKYGRPVPLHQLIFGKLEEGFVVDHINRNRLDNRRENLRVCTALENSYNKSKPKNTKNKYKGVVKSKAKNPTYTASITKDGVRREIKNIGTEEEAAKIYDMMAEELFGEYAAKNFQ
jgi:hypothetical protein